MSNDQTTEAQSIASMSAALQDARHVNGVPFVIVPQDYRFHSLESQLGAPVRKKGTTVLTDEASFIAVLNDQKTNDTRLFSTINPPTFTAVFNHIAELPGWGDHRAAYNAPLSPEWKIWTEKSGRPQKQADFAQFIEDNLPDIVEPAGADLLEVAHGLIAKKNVKFASAIRLSDGSNQFTYEEDVQGATQKGQMAVPDHFVIGIPVFEGGEAWRVDARLRYRISEGGLTLWYELVRPHKVIETAVNELRKRISDATTLAILSGLPSS
ncbi:DUF2303 family protein [Variovorax sp. PMC12]|uniref:DUF2303 family protein n=1 Tax=Variovorax sp. PMC12 TaxID=2126319 RepID=UPI000D12C346|nr:DUF2303 family protein [Variovorax sp. PMC12]AVQ84258.1 hypothetical protein C4F17_26735 [Variovorax sp. PMC12]